MFGSCPGAENLPSLIAQFIEQSRSDLFVAVKQFEAATLTIKPVEFRAVLRPLFADDCSEVGLMAAFLILNCKAGRPIWGVATEYCRRCLRDSDLAPTTFFALAGLGEAPPEFANEVLEALKSNDPHLQLAGAALAGRIDRNGSLLPLAVPLLRRLAYEGEPSLRTPAAIELIAHPVHRNLVVADFDELFGDLEEFELAMLFSRIHPSYSSSAAVFSLLESTAASGEASAGLRSLAYFHLGRVAREEAKAYGALSDGLYSVADESEVLLGIGYGLQQHSQPIRGADISKLLDFLASSSVDFRRSASVCLLENAMELEEIDFEKMATCALTDEDAVVREKLMTAFFKGGRQSIVPAFEAAENADRLSRANWIGALAELLERFPTEWLAYYEKHDSDALDGLLPFVFAQVSLSGNRFTEILSAALQSDSEIERFNALTALTNSGAGVAPVTPSLISLVLRGNEQERQMATGALARIGVAGQAYAATYEATHSERDVEGLQRIQRMMGVREDQVVHAELVRIGDKKLIREFFYFSKLLQQHGPCGMRRLARIIEDGGLADKYLLHGDSANHIKRTLETFESRLRLSSTVELGEVLVQKRRSGSFVTETGHSWTNEVRNYLKDVEENFLDFCED